MKKHFLILFLSHSCFFYSFEAQTLPPGDSSSTASSTSQIEKPSQGEEEELVIFTPPSGWHLASEDWLLPHIKVMVIGQGPSSFPPSMNLSLEPYKGTLKQYLKLVKNMDEAQGNEWKDLGMIRTEAGNATLCQSDSKTQWGDVRLMRVILLKNGKIYILTASALKEEFSLFYNNFFAAMRSLRIAKDVFDMIVNPQQRSELKMAAHKLQTEWLEILGQRRQQYPETFWEDLKKDLFTSEQFQNTVWKPFKGMIDQKFHTLGSEWQSLVLQKMEDNLFNSKTLIELQ